MLCAGKRNMEAQPVPPEAPTTPPILMGRGKTLTPSTRPPPGSGLQGIYSREEAPSPRERVAGNLFRERKVRWRHVATPSQLGRPAPPRFSTLIRLSYIYK